MSATSANFPDALDARFAEVFDERYKQLPDYIGKFYRMVGPGDTPQKQDYRDSAVGGFQDIGEFTGSVSYQDVYEQYDRTLTPKEYASGFQIERKLYDDDLTGIMEGKPRALATAYQRTRQKHAASVFNGAFQNASDWNNFTEGVALCSNSHTTRSVGVSTASGFDNLVTTALSPAALTAARILMVNFRGSEGERISVMPDTLLYPPDLYATAFEITESMGVPDDVINARNVHEGRYTRIEWNYLSDTNNWFLIDSTMMKDALTWFDRIAMEFAMVEDFDTFVGKWRIYCRYGAGHNDWRFILGASVS